MTRCEHITYKVVHQWREELIGNGYQAAPELLAIHHREPLLKFIFVNDDDFPQFRYIYADYSRGWAWLNDQADHRLRTFEYGDRAAADLQQRLYDFSQQNTIRNLEKMR